jgi:hypothetical protein
MVWGGVTLYAQATKKIGNWSAHINGAVTVACVLGLTGILVHSAVDFNLQIPANAALFYVFCSLAAAEPFAPPVRKRRAARTKAPEEIAAEPEPFQQSATNF